MQKAEIRQTHKRKTIRKRKPKKKKDEHEKTGPSQPLKSVHPPILASSSTATTNNTTTALPKKHRRKAQGEAEKEKNIKEKIVKQ